MLDDNFGIYLLELMLLLEIECLNVFLVRKYNFQRCSQRRRKNCLRKHVNYFLLLLGKNNGRAISV